MNNYSEVRQIKWFYQQAEQQYTSWSVGGDKNRALQTVSTIITSSLSDQGANQVVTQAVSPYTAYAIGQYFKNNDSLNRQDGGNRAGEGSKSHLLAHGLLAFATSYATGQSVETITATTLSTIGAEALAPKLSQYLYGTDKVADLTAEQKQTISNVLGTAGLVTGVVTAQATGADSISSVSAGQQAQGSVQNAVENNWGEVGHHSTTAMLMKLGGLPNEIAEAIGNAAWKPDTDSRNALAIGSVFIPSNMNQEHIHLLDGEKDLAKIAQQRQEFEYYLVPIFREIFNGDPKTVNTYLQNKEFQNILHAYGDSFAHLKEDGTHYAPPLGHAFHGTKPDNPYTHPTEYMNYVYGLSHLIYLSTGKQIPQEKLDAFKQVTTTDNIDQQKHIIKSIDDDPKGTISPTAILKGCSGLRRCYSPDKTPVPYNPKTQDKKDITNE